MYVLELEQALTVILSACKVTHDVAIDNVNISKQNTPVPRA
jgi:hypothetical protein